MSEKTLGEKRVRTSFNPSDDSKVQHIKERAAEFINYIDQYVLLDCCEPARLDDCVRLKYRAIDLIEEAAMYAVKAATA